MIGLTSFELYIGICINNAINFFKEYYVKLPRIIYYEFLKGFAFYTLYYFVEITNKNVIFFVVCVAWCGMFKTWIFVISWLYKFKGDQKYHLFAVSGLLYSIPKFTPGGSHMSHIPSVTS